MNLEQVIGKRNNKTIYHCDDTVVKVFDEGYPKSSILNEALNQARVEETGLKIPRVRSVSNVDGHWSISMDYIPGKTLEETMKDSPDRNSELLELFVDLQIDMHSKSAPLLNKLKDKLVRILNNEVDLDASTKYELLTRLDSMPKHTKLCHGDFLPSNIIVTESGPYILDWSHATQGNASADAATTYLKLSLQDPELADSYLKLFCQKSKTSLNYVQQWLPIVAAQQLPRAKDEEIEFLNKWLDVIDYQG
jgi:tRNA A-37 threonylcarbamoyl transferase component Bud32